MKVENFCQILLNSTDKKQYAWNKNGEIFSKKTSCSRCYFNKAAAVPQRGGKNFKLLSAYVKL